MKIINFFRKKNRLEIRNEESLIHFLKTGELGPLNFTLTVDEVITHVGRPSHIRSYEAESKEDYVQSQIDMFYKCMIINFINHNMDMFSFYFYYKEKGLPKALKAPWYYDLLTKDYLWFVDYVKKQNIPCKRIIVPHFEEEKGLIIKHNEGQKITFWFDNEKNDQIMKIICSTLGCGATWIFEDC